MQVFRFSGPVPVAVSTIGLMLIGGGPAAAHWGHLADLSGHAHWAGLALGAVAAALAAGLAMGDRADSEDDDTALNSDDREGDPADA